MGSNFANLRLKLRLLFAAFVCMQAFEASAQSEQSAVTSTMPASARFEIVQSELAARWTFRLDKWCGRVNQLVSSADEQFSWQNMQVDGVPICANSSRYQIFTSGLAAKHTFMIDTQTGVTWQLIQRGDESGWVSLSR